MRALVALLIVLVLALSGAACGGPPEGALEQSQEAQEAQRGGEAPADDEGEPAGEPAADKMADGEGAGDKGGDKLDAAARTLFTDSCGSCHVLADAGTTGTVGPNLDDLPLDASRVAQQIVTGGGAMPGKLLEGDEAEAVAAYVAATAAGAK